MSRLPRAAILILGAVVALLAGVSSLHAQGASALPRPDPNAHIVPRHGMTPVAPADGAAATNLTGHGGRVQHVQKVYTIFWNPPGTPPFPANYQSTIEGFVQDLNNSSYYRIASQYTDTAGPISPILVHGGSWVDLVNALPVTSPSDVVMMAALKAEVARAKTAQGWTDDGNTYYQIFTPSGFDAPYCGKHWLDNPAYGLVLFPSDGCLPFPAPPYPHGDVIDAAIDTTAHEIMETVTNPDATAAYPADGGGWYYQDAANEIADLCTFDKVGTGQRAADGSNVSLNGNPYLVQMEWSNAAGGCTLAGPGLSIDTLNGIPGNAVTPYWGGGAINNHGDVVGAYFSGADGANYARGFKWSGGVVTLIGPSQLNGILLLEPYLSLCVPPNVCSFQHIIPRGINDAGTIVGSVHVADTLTGGASRGFRLSPDGQVAIIDVPGIPLPSWGLFDTWGVNNGDRAVGTYRDPQTVRYKGFLTGFGTIDPPGSTYTWATSVNDAVDVVGFYRVDATVNERGFVWSAGQYADLVVPGAWMTEAYGINTRGDIVGQQVGGSISRAFLFSNGTYTGIADGATELYMAYGINDAGDVLGVTYNPNTGVTRYAVARPRAAPGFVIEPLPQSVAPGQTAQYSVKARGAPTPSIQWQVSTDGGATWANVADGGAKRFDAAGTFGAVNPASYSGATTPTLTITSVTAGMNGMRYRAEISNTIATMSSASALLTVTVPPLTDIVVNGDFGAGTAGWATFGAPTSSYMESTIVNGVYQWRRVPQAGGQPVSQATVYQPTGVALGAGVPVAATFDLGNTSSARKYMKVLLVGDATFTDLAACAFWLPPNTPLTTFSLRAHTTKAWANATIYFYASSPNTDNGYYLLDNVSMQYGGVQAVDRTECIDPNVPTPPGGAAGPNLLTNGDFGTGVLAPWGTVGNVTTQISSNVLEFYRGAAFPPPVIAQATGQAMTANQLVTATFQLGNSSPVRKRVLLLLNDNDFSDLTACTFWLEPGAALASYSMTGWASKAWTNATVSIYPSTQYDAGTPANNPWIRIDNITLQRTPSATTTGTTCLEPGALGGAPPSAIRSSRAPSGARSSGGTAPPGPVGAPEGARLRESGGAPSTAPERIGPEADAWIGDGFARVDGVAGPGGTPVWATTAVDNRPAVLQLAVPLDLRGATRATLHVSSWRTLGAAVAEVQVNVNGTGWTPVASVESSSGWDMLRVDLTAAAGALVDVRFVLDGEVQGDDGGWWLSGLEVFIEP